MQPACCRGAPARAPAAEAPSSSERSEGDVVRTPGRDNIACDDMFRAGLVKGHAQLLALDHLDGAVAELLVEDAVARIESRNRIEVDHDVSRLARLADGAASGAVLHPLPAGRVVYIGARGAVLDV